MWTVLKKLLQSKCKMENVQVQHLKNRRRRGFLLLQNALKLVSVHVEFQKFLGGDTPEPPLRDWTQVTEHSAFSFPNVGIYGNLFTVAVLF